MNKLLSANFIRLKKDKMFWTCVLFMLLFGLYRIGNYVHKYKKYNYDSSLDFPFFSYTIVIGIITAAFSCLFIGTDYKDGGIRNKLVIGHVRSHIYLSNLITTVTASLIMCLAYLVPVCAIGIPVLGSFTKPLSFIGMIFLGSSLMILAFCSLITGLSMMITSKSLSVVAGILGVIGFLALSGMIEARLTAPEFVPHVLITQNFADMTNEIVTNYQPNPQYLKGIQRSVYQFIHDLLPTGQSIQYFQLTAKHLWQMLLYALIISAVSTTVGIYLFKKKDVK